MYAREIILSMSRRQEKYFKLFTKLANQITPSLPYPSFFMGVRWFIKWIIRDYKSQLPKMHCQGKLSLDLTLSSKYRPLYSIYHSI